MLDVEFAQLSDPGRVRQQNEDYLGYILPYTPQQLRSHGCVFALADGVGGQDKGELASRTAVETLLSGFVEARAGEPHKALLNRLVQAANVAVYEAASTPGTGSGMATTLVACAVRLDRAVVAHVGDSRCYLIRGGQPKLMTSDHTVVNEQVRMGLLSRRDAEESENRHILSRSIGNEMFVAVDVSEFQVQRGDLLVLSSDGLHGAVPDADIAALVGRFENLHTAAEKLVALANQRDGGDNVSVQLIRIHDVERTGMYRGRPYQLK